MIKYLSATVQQLHVPVRRIYSAATLTIIAFQLAKVGLKDVSTFQAMVLTYLEQSAFFPPPIKSRQVGYFLLECFPGGCTLFSDESSETVGNASIGGLRGTNL